MTYGDPVMSPVIGELLPVAAGVALSPIPIVAVVLVLGSRHARTAGPAFAAGWVIGIGALMTILVLLADGIDEADGADGGGIDVIMLLIGIALVALAARKVTTRPRGDEPTPMPGWMTSIDHITAGRAFGLALLTSAANPKNLALGAAAAATITQAGLSSGDTVTVTVVFVVLASLTVAGAVIVRLVGGARTERPLEAVKEFMITYNAVIMALILFLFGLKVIGDSLGGLTG
jgi:threonine/homoserine/homoserine lactone efflux protein